ncbi:hypothetical protein BDR26DRAFT_901094 [Obelidium mucronatum]|nr:hypothetical protein BDR26DRAFT_901094 [Obelidium mucronatum]
MDEKIHNLEQLYSVAFASCFEAAIMTCDSKLVAYWGKASTSASIATLLDPRYNYKFFVRSRMDYFKANNVHADLDKVSKRLKAKTLIDGEFLDKAKAIWKSECASKL